MASGKKKAGAMPGMRTFVFSRTLRQRVGSGSFFCSLLDASQVDTVEIAVVRLFLGGGIPLLPRPAKQARLKLAKHKVYKTGIVALK